ncbi:quinolinate synthase NadA [Myxococcota bacterium]|nr:quinolinate synthase NadA [Myxococcota bacterium]MBU1381915.1 quinolinate synthase NadA [Myxococcota bacterium]MBU1497816.1 quinolinate synthase NadA [Myxococcota bacterium]
MDLSNVPGSRQELTKEILELKKKYNAVILVHNYQLDEVQSVADHLGDSLELSRLAAKTSADIIVFCGVHFMAETAYILSPTKTVLLPEINAGCPMADMINPEQLKKLKEENPDAIVVTYVNSSAEIKALSDYCCTSANAEKIVATLPANQKIIFTPDMNLGAWITRKRPDNKIIWPGYCPVHHRLLPFEIEEKKRQFPDAVVIVHPEAPIDVLKLADAVESTGGMVNYVQSLPSGKFVIIGTEAGMINRLRRVRSDLVYIPASPDTVCSNMKKTRLSHVRDSLLFMQHKITVPDEIAEKARRSINRMLEVG